MRTYGLIGRTLGHSFSKNFFAKYFDNQSIHAEYVNFELDNIQEIQQVLQSEIHGLNVTIPYKTEIIPFLDELSPEASAIGAVNTIQFSNGKKIGHNTDAYGFQQSIKPFLTFQHEKALILGTGGASKAVAHVLETIGIDVLYLSRTPCGEKQFAYDEVNEHMLRACKLIVNTTPVGTFPNVDEFISIPFESLTEEHLVVDLIYNPAKTKFLEKSEAAGATILNGQSMLEQQALKAWEIWNS